MRKTFPCPVCKGSGYLDRGEMVDVGIGMVQVSADLECSFCEYGQMVIDGEKHREYQMHIFSMKVPDFLWDEDGNIKVALTRAIAYYEKGEA